MNAGTSVAPVIVAGFIAMRAMSRNNADPEGAGVPDIGRQLTVDPSGSGFIFTVRTPTGTSLWMVDRQGISPRPRYSASRDRTAPGSTRTPRPRRRRAAGGARAPAPAVKRWMRCEASAILLPASLPVLIVPDWWWRAAT